MLHHHVVDVDADREPLIARQRPGRGGPDQRQLAGLQPEPDGDGRVLPLLVDVGIHPELVAGQRGLVAPAVRQDAHPLVHESLVVQGLEGPQDRLHVLRFEGLVIMIEIDPAGLPGDVVLPLVRVSQHRRSTGLIELLDAHLLDVILGFQPELGHRLELGGQPVAVPAEPPLHVATAHRLEAGDDVLDVAGQQVPVVRQPIGERRSVVEDELVRAVFAGRVPLDRGPEGVVGLPISEDPLLDRGEVRAGGHGPGTH